jgi:dolichol-phosphate mannosyltransferase
MSNRRLEGGGVGPAWRDCCGAVESFIVPENDGNGFSPSRQRSGGAAISVVVPVYCEEKILPEFYVRAKAALTSLAPTYSHELIFINDGSTDASLEILHTFARTDPAVRVISLARNFGHQLAITAGLDHATGDAAVVIDADLQDPPELIPGMVRKWEEGFKVVYGVRQSRQGESAFKLATAKLFYRLLSRLSDTPLPLDSGDFRLLDRAVLDALREIREESRYIRGLVSWIGFRQCPIPYQRDVRRAGETKFPVRKMLKFALDGISSFSEKPLRLSSHLGFFITLISLLLAVFIVVRKLLHPDQLIQGWASVMIAVLFLGGIQLLGIGILGEYIGRIFRQSKGRPLYIVAEKVNLPQPAPAPNVPEPHEVAR